MSKYVYKNHTYHFNQINLPRSSESFYEVSTLTICSHLKYYQLISISTIVTISYHFSVHVSIVYIFDNSVLFMYYPFCLSVYPFRCLLPINQ